ncbi:hypothetical protein [Bradyrhizobium sp. CCBAU 51753]
MHPSQLFAWRRDARAERHYRSRHSSCAGEQGFSPLEDR